MNGPFARSVLTVCTCTLTCKTQLGKPMLNLLVRVDSGLTTYYICFLLLECLMHLTYFLSHHLPGVCATHTSSVTTHTTTDTSKNSGVNAGKRSSEASQAHRYAHWNGQQPPGVAAPHSTPHVGKAALQFPFLCTLLNTVLLAGTPSHSSVG